MKNYNVVLLVMFLFLQGCGGCESAEELGKEEKNIAIKAYNDETDGNKGLWVSSEIFVNQGGIGGSEDIKFDILGNNVNLCGTNTSTISTKDVHFYTGSSGNFAKYIDTGINVKIGDYVKFTPIKKLIKIDCDSPDDRIFITDVDKCKNGFYKDDGSNEFVPPLHGKTFELERYLSLFVGVDGKHAHNVFINTAVEHNITDNRGLLSKVFLAPQEYEISNVVDGKKYVHYSELPEIQGSKNNLGTDLGFVMNQIGPDTNDEKKVNEVQRKYWCREYGRYRYNDGGTIKEKALDYNENVNGVLLGQLCDKFYYLDKDKNKNDLKPDNETLMQYNAWENASLDSKNKGNTNVPNKMISFMDNKSYRIETLNNIEGLDPSIADKIDGDQYISLTHSRFFYLLDATISNTTPASGNGMGNVNEDYTKCSDTSYIARCDARGRVQIPLDQNIEMQKDGKLYVRIGTPEFSNYAGQADINVSKFCPLKEIYAYVLPMHTTATLNIAPGASNTIAIPIVDNKGEMLDEFTIKGSDIKSDGFIYFAIKDNGDGYKNNTGSVKIKTWVPKNFKDNALSFINRISDKIMDIMYGKKDPITGQRKGGVTNILYDNLITSQRFQSLINIMAVLSITIYGIAIATGMMQISGGELVRKIFKLGTVFVLLQPGSWEFFNHFLFGVFVDGARDLAAFVTVPADEDPFAAGNERYVFGPIADLIERLLDLSIWKQVIALLFAGPFGYIFFLFLKSAMFSLLEGSFMVFLTFVSSMFIIGLLISITPLFLITLLFQATSHIFKEWIKILISNVLTIVLVFAGINLISGIVSLLINQVFGFGICTSCALTYDVTDNFQICLMYAALPDGYDNTMTIEEINNGAKAIAPYAEAQGKFFGIPIPFGSFLAFCIICPLVSTFHEFCTNIASELTGVDFGSPVGRPNLATSIGDTMKWWGGKDTDGTRAAYQKAFEEQSEIKKARIQEENEKKMQTRRSANAGSIGISTSSNSEAGANKNSNNKKP